MAQYAGFYINSYGWWMDYGIRGEDPAELRRRIRKEYGRTRGEKARGRWQKVDGGWEWRFVRGTPWYEEYGDGWVVAPVDSGVPEMYGSVEKLWETNWTKGSFRHGWY